LGVALGKESLDLGIDILLGPAINIKRNPLCGKNFDCISDFWRVGFFIYKCIIYYISFLKGSAYVCGIQSVGVGACIKHFAFDNQETNRFYINK
jgi:beta-glucosidase